MSGPRAVASTWPSPLPSSVEMKAEAGSLAEAAKRIYDGWDQDDSGWDEVLGEGGICHEIASAMIERLGELGVEHALSIHASVGENHVFVVALLDDGVYSIDIPPFVYETGSGYAWRKRQDASFEPDCVVIERLSGTLDPGDFEAAYAD